MEPKAQFHIIIKALKTYIREKLENGKVIFDQNKNWKIFRGIFGYF